MTGGKGRCFVGEKQNIDHLLFGQTVNGGICKHKTRTLVLEVAPARLQGDGANVNRNDSKEHLLASTVSTPCPMVVLD
jgi:hypothetical protein